MSPEWKAKERDLRHAVETQHHAEVRAAVVSMHRAAEAHLNALPRHSPESRNCLELTLALLEWARQMLLARRSLTLAQLDRLPRTDPRFLPPPPTATIHLNG